MNLGNGRLKLTVSTSQRRLRLGVSHHNSATTWVAPSKDRDQGRRDKRKRR